MQAMPADYESAIKEIKRLKESLAIHEGLKDEMVSTELDANTAITPGSHDHSLAGYLKKPISRVLLQRVPWLIALMLFQSLSAAILNGFESLLKKHMVIALFIPMIVGTGIYTNFLRTQCKVYITLINGRWAQIY